MQVVQGRNVNTVWIDGLWRLKLSGLVEESRAGRVIVLPEPLTSVYVNPWERVLFHPERDANPWFHLMESLWMLAGRGDVEFVAQFNPRIRDFSDNGIALQGAYGYRWREYFAEDQLLQIIEMLRADPTTRRAVLTMWNPNDDLGSVSKDIPCNTHIYFRVRDQALHMTICCRSNDAVWGAYGANAVHFSVLHEVVARACGLAQGVMTQISNNFHIYERHWNLLRTPVVLDNYYRNSPITLPLFSGTNYVPFISDCERLCRGELGKFQTLFFQGVVSPALAAWKAHKEGNPAQAHIALSNMPMCDWFLTMEEWLQRRVKL